MSDTIDLPAGVRWVTEELGVLVVEGDLIYVSPNQPPLVASRNPPRKWAQYDKPCDHCTRGWPPTGVKTDAPKCPDCIDGQRKWFVRYACPTCGGGGSTGTGYECPPCDGRGFDSWWATIQVVPVTDVHTFNDGSMILELGPELNCKMPLLDSLPVSGRDWVVIARKVAA